MWLLFAVFESQAAASDPQCRRCRAAGGDAEQHARVAVLHAGRRRSAADDQRADGPRRTRARSRSGCRATAGSTRRAASRIPIDEAKKLIVERGLPVREGEAVSPDLGTGCRHSANPRAAA